MASTGNTFPGTGENNADDGVTAWTNPGNITADDGANATCSTASSSQWLVGRNYGFSIPSGSTINGVTVRLEAAETSPGNESVAAQLQNDSGTLIGSSKTNNVNGTSFTVYTYGSSSDVWGATLTTTIVNHANFGVRFRYQTSHDVQVDYCTIAIDYTEPSVGTIGTMLRSGGVIPTV